jgi:hypothetical protein
MQWCLNYFEFVLELTWLDIVIIKPQNPAQESRTQNRVTIFTRRSRKMINKMKELPNYEIYTECHKHTRLY